MSITPTHGTPSPDDQAAAPAYGSSEPYSAQAYGASATSGLPAAHGVAPYAPTGQPAAVVAVKTPGIAVLLTFLWLGAGHLYAGRTTTGLALLGVNVFLFLLLMVPLIGWVLAPMAWIGLFIFAAISSAGAVKQHNARYGVTRY
jgi:TM2 domain-containing membrane protein YozV